jgi:hypothetical protein
MIDQDPPRRSLPKSDIGESQYLAQIPILFVPSMYILPNASQAGTHEVVGISVHGGTGLLSSDALRDFHIWIDLLDATSLRLQPSGCSFGSHLIHLIQ